MGVDISPWGSDEVSRAHWEGRVLTVIHQRIRPTEAADWTVTDAAGHEHFYGNADVPFPTLVRVSDGLAEPAGNPDDNSAVDRYHLACGQCGESIWPSPDGPGTDALTGVFLYWIDDEPVDQRAARDFTNLIREGEPDRWRRMYGWLKYSAGLVPNAARISRD